MIDARAFRGSRIGIIGGGTAGLLCALALKEWRPELEVELVESSKIPVIGVGEATTPPLVAFLHGYLGIDPERFAREVQPTWKLGIRFEWGRPEPWHFNYAFGDGDLADAQAHDGHPLRYSLTSQLMDAGKGPIARVGERTLSLLRETRFAYHLDNVRLVRFLHAQARTVGIGHVDATIADVRVQDGRVAELTTDDGRTLRYDLYVDCTGFRSLLLGKALGVPFESYEASLFTDTAVTAVRPHGGRVRPYTMATTMRAGWCWTIPMRDEEHLGYVHASPFLSADEARAEMAAKFTGCTDFKVVRFVSGRRRDFVSGNVVAIGNAYGFVEPLESTALHMVIVEVQRLLGVLASGGASAETTSVDIGRHWDWLRWFLALHYRLNERLDTPFWREVRARADISGIAPAIDDFRAHGPFSARATPPRFAGDAVFGPRGLDIMLLGQGVVPETSRAKIDAADWRALVAMRETVVAHALPLADALAAVDADPVFAQELVHDPASWCRAMADDMRRAAPPAGRSAEALAAWARERRIDAAGPLAVVRAGDRFGESARVDFGKFIRRTPTAVIRPADTRELGETLRMLGRRRIPFVVRGAGHSSGGQTLIEGGVVVDMQAMDQVLADDGESVRVAGGIWWQALCERLRVGERRPRVLTDNWRSTVAGTLAVGGFGDATHRYGLQIEMVRGLTIVTVDGERHAVGPGHELDWSLAGGGQLGAIADVTLEVVRQARVLVGRFVRWPSLAAFVAAVPAIVEGERFDFFRARLAWDEAGAVTAVAGHLAGVRAADYAGLGGDVGHEDRVDLHAKGLEATDERWDLASPSVELVLPLDAAGLAALEAIRVRVREAGLGAFLPRGSSVVPLRGRARFPLAPVPASDLALMVAIRPEMPLAEVPRHLPALHDLGDIALAAGGRLYMMSTRRERADFLDRQLGAGVAARWRELKARWDPDGLIAPAAWVPRA